MPFTKYIKNMKANEWRPKLLDELAKALDAEMKRYGVFNLPPSAIGYEYWDRWNYDAFNDLCNDCYIQIILKQLILLQAYLKLGQNIDGIIIQNINFFIIAKFRSCDKVGGAVDDQQAGNIDPYFYEDKILQDDTYKNLNYFSYLCKQIRDAIEQSDYKDDVREHLHRIFTEIEVAIKQRKDTPSQAEIASSLGIPASTLHGYIKKLLKLISLVKSNKSKQGKFE